ncbi:MAG: hypothetical protein ABIB43_05630 [archaeon]
MELKDDKTLDDEIAERKKEAREKQIFYKTTVIMDAYGAKPNTNLDTNTQTYSNGIVGILLKSELEQHPSRNDINALEIEYRSDIVFSGEGTVRNGILTHQIYEFQPGDAWEQEINRLFDGLKDKIVPPKERSKEDKIALAKDFGINPYI